MAGTIIISYRESDATAMAHRLGDRLEYLGYHCLFVSEDRGTSGRDYPAGREDTIAAGDGFVTVIGPRWLVRYDERGRPGIHHRDLSGHAAMFASAISLAPSPVAPNHVLKHKA
jgi:hypothetical protein